MRLISNNPAVFVSPLHHGNNEIVEALHYGSLLGIHHGRRVRGGGGGGGGRVKNTYEVLNARALKISMLYKKTNLSMYG